MSMVNKGDENITSSLFIKGTNKPSKETEWKFLNYLWNNMRSQENTNQVNIKSSTPSLLQKEQHKFTYCISRPT
jgi:hypothetical protein